jgi:hypothetical protein
MSVGPLKVLKRDNFELVLFTLSEPIWVCDLGTGQNQFFINIPLILRVFCFFVT